MYLYARRVHDAILLTAAASWYLVGLGLTVGLVTYPAFSLVGEEQWSTFHRHHSTRISFAVGVAWIAQAAGLLWWLMASPRLSGEWITCGVAAAMAVLLTGMFAVGLHNRLSNNRRPAHLRRLRVVHVARTLAWIIAAAAALGAL